MKSSDLKEIRLEKLEKIKSEGINPYTYKFDKEYSAAGILNLGEGKTVRAAGRITSIRPHGKATFIDLTDQSGRIQTFFEVSILGEKNYEFLRNLDNGDFVGVYGETFKTIVGELTIRVKDYELLTKAILPLPSLWHGLKDVEERFRKRYLDLILNPEARIVFEKRTQIISAVRELLDSRSYLEVETPTLQTLYGGANARPFMTHHNALDLDLYLKISDELYLKRLIVGGFEKVYEIDHDFRNEGIDKTHNPEFTMMECYEAYSDYEDMMNLTEDLYNYVAQKVLGTTKITYQGREIDLKKPWPRITMREAIKKYLNVEVDSLSDKELLEEIKKRGLEYEGEPVLTGVGKGFKRGIAIATLFEAVESFLIDPVFITDFPAETTALAKLHRKDKALVERFEPYINGWEIGNGYSELNDPQQQRKGFEEQVEAGKSGDEEAMPLDEDYVEALGYGMPPTGGLGIGIDRMTILLTNVKSIKEVILFPLLKPTVQNTTKKQKGYEELSLPQKDIENKVQKLNNEQIFSIDKEVAQKFPSISIGIAIIKGVNITNVDKNLEQEKEQIISTFEGLTTEQLGEENEIKSYRKLYKETGIDWHSRRPSPEALLRRIILKKGLYTVNTCVDAYNLVVMKNRISVGAFDLDKIKFPTVLRFAHQDEVILLLGEEEPTKYKEGEVAYFDQNGGYNIDFNYRDAQRIAVQLDTKNLYINVDGVYDISPQKVEKVLQEACGNIIKYCGGKLELFELVTS